MLKFFALTIVLFVGQKILPQNSNVKDSINNVIKKNLRKIIKGKDSNESVVIVFAAGRKKTPTLVIHTYDKSLKYDAGYSRAFYFIDSHLSKIVVRKYIPNQSRPTFAEFYFSGDSLVFTNANESILAELVRFRTEAIAVKSLAEKHLQSILLKRS
jgi:hypothetical protein